MYFGPFELQACGENDFTIKTLGLIAHRPDLRSRLLEKLVGPQSFGRGERVSMLFFSRIGENFFREAIEREYSDPERQFETRCNAALGLPARFKWRRNVDGRLTQPAKWQSHHIQEMLSNNNVRDDGSLRERLEALQDCLNTEPDVVLQWEDQLALIEVKVLSGEGSRQLERQRLLAAFLAALTGLRVHLFLLGPAGTFPTDSAYQFVSWAQLADWYSDIPQVSQYIRDFGFLASVIVSATTVVGRVGGNPAAPRGRVGWSFGLPAVAA